MKLLLKRRDHDEVLVQFFQRMELFPGTVYQHGISGLQWTIGQLPVVSFAGLVDGQGVQTECLAKADLLDRLTNKVGSGRDHAFDDTGQRWIEHIALEAFRLFSQNKAVIFHELMDGFLGTIGA